MTMMAMTTTIAMMRAKTKLRCVLQTCKQSDHLLTVRSIRLLMKLKWTLRK